jgi:hypothetical protein
MFVDSAPVPWAWMHPDAPRTGDQGLPGPGHVQLGVPGGGWITIGTTAATFVQVTGV